MSLRMSYLEPRGVLLNLLPGPAEIAGGVRAPAAGISAPRRTLRPVDGTSSLRILVAGSDPASYMLVDRLLSDTDEGRYELDWANNYDSAIEAAFRDQHHAYLIADDLGTRRGVDLLREALSSGCEVPMILMTGAADGTAHAEAMNAGAADYLVMDRIDAPSLERSIRYSLERSDVHAGRVRLEHDLNHSQRLGAVAQLAAGLPHDLNDLLTTILSYAQLGLSMGPIELAHWERLQQIQSAAQRAADLARRVPGQARYPVEEPVAIDLNELVIRVARMLRPCARRDTELVTLPSADLGLIRADQAKIDRAVVALMVHARDATPVGGQLTIRTTNETVHANSSVPLRPGLSPVEYVTLV